jgi:hypothetical protein
MAYMALVEAFSHQEDLPVKVDSVLDWIRDHTDHKEIRLHAVDRHKKAFRGAFRRISIPTGKMYSHEFEVITQVLYGKDLDEKWKRLVIVKEALHVFDPDGVQINTPENVRRLIQAVITPELKGLRSFLPAVSDYLGAYRAMAVMLPRHARRRLKAALDADKRTATEIADYVKLPDHLVGIWLDIGDEIEHQLLKL